MNFLIRTPLAFGLMFLAVCSMTSLPTAASTLAENPPTPIFLPAFTPTTDTWQDPFADINTSHDNSPNTAPDPSTLDEAALLADVALFTEILNLAIDMGNLPAIIALTPLYEQASGHDVLLLNFAKAVLAHAENRPKTAIAHYQAMLENDPSLTPVKMRLAFSYLTDHRYHQAKTLIGELLADDTVPQDIKDALNAALTATLSTTPKTELHLSYLNDRNVNNAPDHAEHGHWQLPAKKTAQGVGYGLSFRHPQPLTDHLSISPVLNLNGKYYPNAKDYNDLITELGTSFSYEDGRQHLSATPYGQRRYFGETGYSHTHGLRLAGTLKTRPWQLSALLDVSKKYYDDRPFLEGSHRYGSISMGRTYAGAIRHGEFGVQVGEEALRDASDSRKLWRIYAGFGVGTGSVGSSHRIGVGRARHQGADIFGILRHDTLYFSEHKFWHENWHYHGYSPALNLRFERQDSSHFAHDKTAKDIFLSVDKRF
ncbi:MAG: surface lipoprotein assembly modifier [Moraxella sp.]|nr:surface lipoprotein assembly modifier [Moraxella sp.]